MGYEYLAWDLNVIWAKTVAFEYSTFKANYTKSPKEFEDDGFGDCEDFAIYMIYHLGKQSRLVAIRIGKENHAIVGYQGLYIEPRVYGMFYDANEIKIVKEYSYDYIMRYATRWGTKSLY